jgi:hypothetical protein
MKYALVVNKVNEIFDDYPGMKLTLRQIFYRLVAEHDYPNTKSKYTQLSTQLVKARKIGHIDESRIEDRSRQFIGKTTVGIALMILFLIVSHLFSILQKTVTSDILLYKHYSKIA